MARQAQKNAQNTYNAAQGVQRQGSGLFNQSNTNANSIFGPLMDYYTKEANNPTGIGPSGLAAENTASEQSTGGAAAGAVGQGGLLAARTRNLGSDQATNDESAREAMRVNSQNAVQNQAENEKLKLAEKSEGLRGLSGLYDQNMNEILGSLGAENSSLGEENSSTNAMTNAASQGWLQNMNGILGSLGSLGGGVGAAAKGF